MYNESYIAQNIRDLRDDIRDGSNKVTRDNFRQKVLGYLAIGQDALAFNVKKRALPRFVKLFDIPVTYNAGDLANGAFVTPVKITQDDYAWALQNFLNRRADPWAFKRTELEKTLDSPTAFYTETSTNG